MAYVTGNARLAARAKWAGILLMCHDGRLRGYIRQAIEATGECTLALFDEAARGFLLSEPEIETGLN